MSRRLKNKSLKQVQEKILSTRKEFFEVSAKMLKLEPSIYRHIVLGPFCFCPIWYNKKRELAISTINYEEKLINYLSTSCRARNHNVRIIFRNTDRFVEKINRFISRNERDLFINDCLDNIDTLFGENFNKGPDIRCIDTGFIKTGMIYNNGVIQTFRRSPNAEINAGELITSKSKITKEINLFDNIFDYNYPGQDVEINKLKKFVRNLWT